MLKVLSYWNLNYVSWVSCISCNILKVLSYWNLNEKEEDEIEYER